MKTSNGDEIFGLWQYDRADGMAKIRRNNCSDFKNVIFKNDMMIEDPGTINLDCADISYVIFSVLFLLIFIAGIIIGIFKSSGVFAAAGGSWCIYQLVCCCNS